ncbi:hypothetical protein Nepgr_000036 [Nepenthes gracilis]|uniref:Uncharacterized protein n=1 Tax=Nepenthes gracilis TaxID=150966 RepID=A0AAD3P393_NEPGR|nr:hypothetical protein Nepgr_000036 [Nepenthes gracilis]
MSSDEVGIPTAGHLVAMPYPGRGHVNPMLNLCKLLASRATQILITFVVTEEWRGFLSSESTPANVRFGTLPQVIPSEVGRAADFHGFIEAVLTKLEAPFEQLVDSLEPPATAIIYDTYLLWMVGLGNRRNMPVASLFTMSASVFSVFFHYDLLVRNGHFPADVSERGSEPVDYIPGLPPTTIANLPTIFCGDGRKTLHRALEAVSSVLRAQYLLFISVHELESQVIDSLKSKFTLPIYPIGPMIPFFDHEKSSDTDIHTNQSYLRWLDSQPKSSVLYVSMGSFLSVSSAQMDEIVGGIRDSGVRYMWVTRGDTSRFKDGAGEMGCLVSWCDQLKVLCHPSVGGFWTHCGWNSTSEGVFAGVPMLTYPIFWDQMPNSKMIVEDWKIGWTVRKNGGPENLVKRNEIAEIVRNFMDLGSQERGKMEKRAKRLQGICKGAIADGGSAASNLLAFIQETSRCQPKPRPQV